MSKFRKFQPTIPISTATVMLAELTGEEVTTELIQQLTPSYLTRLLGCQEALVGFNEEEFFRLASGEAAKARTYSEIGIAPLPDGLEYAPGAYASIALEWDGEDEIYFVRMTDCPDCPSVANEWTLDKIAPLDPGEIDSWSFLPFEIYEIAKAANSDDAPMPRPIDQKPRLLIRDWPEIDMSIVEGMTGLSRPYGVHYSEAEMVARRDRASRSEYLGHPPSAHLTVFALIELLKSPARARPKGLNQSAIVDTIAERFPWRGLSKSSLDRLFSDANKAGAEAEKTHS